MKALIIIALFVLGILVRPYGQESFVRDLIQTVINDDPTAFDKLSSFTKEEFYTMHRDFLRGMKYNADRIDNSWRHYLRDRYVVFTIFSENNVDLPHIQIDSINVEEIPWPKGHSKAKVLYHTDIYECNVTLNLVKLQNGKYRVRHPIDNPNCIKLE